MGTVDIKVTSDNPDLIEKVRAGIVLMLDQVGLDSDNGDRYYDLTLTATSPLAGVVYGSEYDGAQNNNTAGSPAADVLRLVIDHLRLIEDDQPDAEAADYAKGVIGLLQHKFWPTEHLYEKCQHCHLFVEPNDAHTPGDDLAKYIHLHRGDLVDERLDESHEPEPSGRRANLLTWKTYGPEAMRERFTS